jgi:hypothetical protein
VTIDDGTLNYLPVPPATTPTTALDVTGAAYTNNDLDPNTAQASFLGGLSNTDTVIDIAVSVTRAPPRPGKPPPLHALDVKHRAGI